MINKIEDDEGQNLDDEIQVLNKVALWMKL